MAEEGKTTEELTDQQIVDAQEDAEFDRIVPDSQSEPSAAVGTEALDAAGHQHDEHGRFVTKDAEPIAQTTEPSKPTESTETAEPGIAPEGVNPQDYSRAYSALQRDKVPSKTLKSLSTQEVLDWGLGRADTQLEVDRYQARLEKAEQAVQSADTQPETEVQPDQPVSDLDWDELTAPFAAALKEVYGDDVKAAEPFKSALKQATEHTSRQLQAQMNAQFEQQQKVMQLLQVHVINREMDRARSVLKDDFNLGDDARWKRVTDRIWANPPSDDDPVDAVRSAAIAEFSSEIMQQNKANIAQQHKLRDNGLPVSPSTSPSEVKAPSKDELEDEFLDASFDDDEKKKEELRVQMNPSRGTGYEDFADVVIGGKRSG